MQQKSRNIRISFYDQKTIIHMRNTSFIRNLDENKENKGMF